MCNDGHSSSVGANDHNSNNHSYRPRSPDLSAFTPRRQPDPSNIHSATYLPALSVSNGVGVQQSPHTRQASSSGYSGFGSTTSPVTRPRGSYDANPYFTPKGSVDMSYQPAEAESRQPFAFNPPVALTQSPVSAVHRGGWENDYIPPHEPARSPSGGPGQQAFTQAPLVFQSLSSANPPQIPPPEPGSRRGRRRRAQPDGRVDAHMEPRSSQLPATGGGPHAARETKKRKSGDGRREWTVGRAPGEPGPSLGIEVKTKFPVARIKRIMQADEDVGKVAQATPTAVSKALELFMIALVTKAAAEANERSSKRVTAIHLKQAVVKEQTFDFLQEIMDRVSEAAERKSGAQTGSDDGEEGEAAPVKKKRGSRGRKKAGSDEE